MSCGTFWICIIKSADAANAGSGVVGVLFIAWPPSRPSHRTLGLGCKIVRAYSVWLGHANIATSTHIYDWRSTRPKDRPALKVAY